MKEFQAKLSILPQMLTFIKKDLTSLEEKQMMKIEMACEEALVNIIHHAYPKEAVKPYIRLQVSIIEAHLSLTIQDAGIPFNPLKYAIRPDFEKPAEERQLGGLGIAFIKNIMDKVEYEYKDGENTLRLQIKL